MTRTHVAAQGVVVVVVLVVFSGALITEVVFGYPGLGTTLYNGIISADYNLIMGITLLSIIGIATASLLVDLTYPLLDPRVRYR